MRFSLFVHMERWDESVSHRQLFENLTELAADGRGRRIQHRVDRRAPRHGIHHLAQPDAAAGLPCRPDHDHHGSARAPSSRRSGTRSAPPANAHYST